jgi:DNA-binding FadR family transcriptional regulator
VIYLYLWLRTHGDGKARVHQSHQQLADAIGLSKSAVQTAVRILARRRLVDVKRRSKTATAKYHVERPWSE